MTTLDAYIRVSQKGDREGESYRSPKQQTEAMAAWASANDATIAKTVTDENVSGKKRVKDRKLEELIVRAEQGITDGMVAALERDLADARSEMWSHEDPGLQGDATIVTIDGKPYV